MKRMLVLCLIGTAFPAIASSELERAFGPAISVKQQKSRAVVEYCPANTCERYVAPGSRSLPALQDFALAYLFGVSEYYYLKQFQESPSPTVAAVLAQHRSGCAQSEPRAAASCVARALLKQHHIKVSRVRYDEGARVETPVEFK